jgi:hypothetical protein
MASSTPNGQGPCRKPRADPNPEYTRASVFERRYRADERAFVHRRHQGQRRAIHLALVTQDSSPRFTALAKTGFGVAGQAPRYPQRREPLWTASAERVARAVAAAAFTSDR